MQGATLLSAALKLEEPYLSLEVAPLAAALPTASIPPQPAAAQSIATLAALAALASGAPEAVAEAEVEGEQLHGPSDGASGRGKRAAAQREAAAEGPPTAVASQAGPWALEAASAVGSASIVDGEGLLHLIAELDEGQCVTVTALPRALAASWAAPASKRPRRAAARAALAVLQAEQQAADIGPQAAHPELEGRMFKVSLDAAPAAAAALAARRKASREGVSGGSTTFPVPHSLPLPFERRQPPQAAASWPEVSESADPPGVVAVTEPSGLQQCSGQAGPGPEDVEEDAMERGASSNVMHQAQLLLQQQHAQQQQREQQELQPPGTVHVGGLPAAAPTPGREGLAAEQTSAAGDPSNGGPAADDFESMQAAVDEEVEGDEDGEELSRPGSPTASEAALLGELMQQERGSLALSTAFQPDIASAFATAIAASPPGDAVGGCGAGLPAARARRLAGRLGKRKGGMPAVCPSCGQPPLSEEDKRAAAKRGRRKKNDESDPRNRKAELTKDFLVAHLVDARLSLRDICYYHGHCATTLSRVARNLGMELPCWRMDRKQETSLSLPPPEAAEGALDAMKAVHAAGLTVAGSVAAPVASRASGMEELPVVAVLGAAAEADMVAKEALQALEAAAPRHLGPATVTVAQQAQQASQQPQQQQQELAASLWRAASGGEADQRAALAAFLDTAQRIRLQAAGAACAGTAAGAQHARMHAAAGEVVAASQLAQPSSATAAAAAAAELARVHMQWLAAAKPEPPSTMQEVQAEAGPCQPPRNFVP